MGEVVALAVGIALSPFPVVPAILLLFTARPRPTAFAFLAGWFTGVGLTAGVFALLAEVVQTQDASPRWLSALRVAVGVALVGYGVHGWLTRHASSEVPGWIRTIQEATPRSAVRLALVLSLANPKILLLAAAAGADLGAGELSGPAVVAAVVGFALLASVTVAAPVLLYAVRGDAALPPLARAKDWLLANNAAVMAVVVTVIGVLLLVKGVRGW